MTLKSSSIKRGDVYWVNLDPTIGTEVQKTRPAVIVSNNVQNSVSTRVVVIPISSSVKKLYPFEAKIALNKKPSKALTDQIRAVDKERLRGIICHLDFAEVQEIDKALKLTLSLG